MATVLLMLAAGVALFLVGAWVLGPVPAVLGMLLATVALFMLPIVGFLEWADSEFDDGCRFEYATEFCR